MELTVRPARNEAWLAVASQGRSAFAGSTVYDQAIAQVELPANSHTTARSIKTTAEHPFFVAGQNEFVPAGELHVGDLLISHDDQLIEVTEVRSTDEVTTVYNLRVADHHTYFVGGTIWAFDVWVHNAYQVDTRFRNGSKLIKGDAGDLWYLPARYKTTQQVTALAKVDRYGSILQVKAQEIASGFSIKSLSVKEQRHLNRLWEDFSNTRDTKWIGIATEFTMRQQGQFVEKQLNKWIDTTGLDLVRKHGSKGIDYQDPLTGVYYELLRGSVNNIRKHAYRPGMTNDIWQLVTFL